MTKPIAEQVAELKVGDWAIVEFYDADDLNRWKVEGCIYSGAGGSLFIGNDIIRFNTGNIDPNLISITRVPRPIPSEPEVGSFGLCDDGVTTQKRTRDFDTDLLWQRNNLYCSWSEIYPHITRLYTPSGDLVTGFEYAGGGE